MRKWKEIYLNDIEVQNHVHCIADFVLEPVHFETHALEDDLRTRRSRDLLDDARDLCCVECRGRQQDIELRGK